MSIALIPRELPREPTPVQTGVEMLRQIRSFTGRRLIAHAVGGNLKFYRYDDAAPDAISQTITVASGSCTCCSLTQRGCGTLDLLFCQAAAVKWAVSRDEGVTWSITAVQTGTPPAAATGYGLVEHRLGQGMLVTMLHQTAGLAWYCSVGTIGDANTWVWTAPATVGPARRSPGTLRHLQDGSWQFACVDASNQPVTYTCRSLKPDGTGTWVASAGASGYQQVAQHVAGNMYVQPVYNTATSTWMAFTAVRGTGYTWTPAAVTTVTAGKSASGSLIQSGAGQWEFAYVPVGATVPSIKRCKALKPDGTGAWE